MYYPKFRYSMNRSLDNGAKLSHYDVASSCELLFNKNKFIRKKNVFKFVLVSREMCFSQLNKTMCPIWGYDISRFIRSLLVALYTVDFSKNIFPLLCENCLVLYWNSLLIIVKTIILLYWFCFFVLWTQK